MTLFVDQAFLKPAKPLCWDCEKRIALYPVILVKSMQSRLKDDEILAICQRCFNRWRPYLHVGRVVTDPVSIG